jgi:hypothetical protein
MLTGRQIIYTIGISAAHGGHREWVPKVQLHAGAEKELTQRGGAATKLNFSG